MHGISDMLASSVIIVCDYNELGLALDSTKRCEPVRNRMYAISDYAQKCRDISDMLNKYKDSKDNQNSTILNMNAHARPSIAPHMTWTALCP